MKSERLDLYVSPKAATKNEWKAPPSNDDSHFILALVSSQTASVMIGRLGLTVIYQKHSMIVNWKFMNRLMRHITHLIDQQKMFTLREFEFCMNNWDFQQKENVLKA